MAADGQSWQVNIDPQPAKDLAMEDLEMQVLSNVINDFKESIAKTFSCTECEYNSDKFNVNKGVNLSEVLKRLSDLRLPANSSTTIPDTWNHISILSKSLQEYLLLLESHQRNSIADRIYSDCQTWLSELFSLDNLQSSFHNKELDGVVKVCKLALHSKYPKYASDGFTALYTRPPVIYISSAAPPEFSKQLQNQLGLPQSSVCSVPCNTMFGSPFTMDVSALERLLTDDVSCGKTPLILIAYAGTPLTGHTDNLSRLREICTQSGVWFHVEGDTLANLALSQTQPSIQIASSADSLTLNLSRWFGISSLPHCTYYRCNNTTQAELSGLIADSTEKLSALCVWVIVQFMGTHDLQNMIEHSSVLAQQMISRLDVINGVKRIEQPSGLSPVVIYKYKASPSLPLTLDDTEEKGKILAAAPRGKIEVSERLTNSFNQKLCDSLNKENPALRVEAVEIPREGLCMKFDPLLTSRAKGTSKVDVDNYIESLQQKIIMMDNLLVSRDLFTEMFSKISDVIVLDTKELPIMGAFQCIPKYWKTKTMSNLSDLKKQEANELNLRIYQALCTQFEDVLVLAQQDTGLNTVQLGMVGESFNLQLFSELVAKLTVEFEDNAKFVESVTDSIQKSIEEAQDKLNKEREEKFFQDGVLRSVPVVASFYNWFSPPPKEDHGVTGRSFDLSSGKLDSTEQTYKFKMQVHDDQSDLLSNASDISKASALETSSVKDPDETSTSAEMNDVTVNDDVETGEPIQTETSQEQPVEKAEEAGQEDVRESDV
ncbi:pyridoxal-dependent decarboxylase domain-containing protein 1-like [Clytia hemisphaerica]|uniref:Pyridoxal-dependent decarboxylase domain-containing protein 1 n=1 Tax=Clytia hemisphaerica TaxID=252671 RepID=A0A7M5XCS2_9CNID